MAHDLTICGKLKSDNIARLRTYIVALIEEAEKHSDAQKMIDRIEIAAWSRLLDEYVRGEFVWDAIFPKPVLR